VSTTDLIPVPGFLRDVLEAEGLRHDELLRRAGVPATRFRDERLRITTQQFFDFWRQVEASGLSPDFGLRLVTERSPQQFDVASAAALHSANLGEALGKLARYKRLTCPEDVAVELDGAEARVRVTWLCTDASAPALIVDGAFAALHRLAAIGMGRTVTPVRLELTRVSGQERLLARHFGCEIRLGASNDVLVFDRADLERPFQSHNPDLLELMLPALEASLKAHSASMSLADHVRVALRGQLRGMRPGIEEVAGSLGTSPRTLQRRLSEEGTSYQRLLDEVRRSVARRLLSETELDAGEIAFVLGFEELNSFTRAFQAWEGTTPRRWRGRRLES
jgi:AraC-like DNA-binding protein